ncbi:hypothetical protein LD119_00683 [Mesoplasma sp. JKS002660]|uniref:tRNA (adenosine(37)-N6)-threonylcarbamoyltransferase complex dimerization subunit type 1 TsaB n=1 Tax=Mesoplasma whartonense TaxID=2878854 RepID=UPI002022A307|nr:tRNA (adenosine(37)-N6)-threonylcarbamoyltransferase complex dimerization subunit type 1 TsaB [Mesoplasma sp. JKS002660]MCL8213733.1 hypothetical protein [Mesoplasma sp. JKS002660]
MNLFIDTSNWNLILILEQDNLILDQVVVRNTKKVSDLLLVNIQSLFAKNQLTIQDIKRFYLTTGPGSYTGERVGLTFVKTLKVINPTYEVYLINSLAYQAGKGKKVSLLDARGGKFYLGIYDNQQPLVAEQVIATDGLTKLLATEVYQDFQVVQDYQDCDFSQHYLTLKPNFQLTNDLELLTPTYLKPFL